MKILPQHSISQMTLRPCVTVYSVCVAALQLLQLKSRHEKRG